MISWLAGCAPAFVGGDDVLRVTAAPRGPEVLVRVEVAAGWHLNREYPIGFEGEAEVEPFAFDDDRRGHLTLRPRPAGPVEGTVHVGFCDVERCRIEAVLLWMKR